MPAQNIPEAFRRLLKQDVCVDIKTNEQAEEAVQICETYGVASYGYSTTVDSILDRSSVWPNFGTYLHLSIPKIAFCKDYRNRGLELISFDEFLAASNSGEINSFDFTGDFGDIFAGIS